MQGDGCAFNMSRGLSGVNSIFTEVETRVVDIWVTGRHKICEYHTFVHISMKRKLRMSVLTGVLVDTDSKMSKNHFKWE